MNVLRSLYILADSLRHISAKDPEIEITLDNNNFDALAAHVMSSYPLKFADKNSDHWEKTDDRIGFMYQGVTFWRKTPYQT